MMKHQISKIRCIALCGVSCLVAIAAASTSAEAQTATAAAPPAAPAEADQAGGGSHLNEIIVTGSARRGTALETSYAVTVLGAQEIKNRAPIGLTDLVNSVPGLQGEFANGEVNSNLNVRGTQGGFMSFISLQEDGLPVQYSPFFSEYELRYDLTYARVEAVLGGPSGIFTAQGSAATINYISRKPKVLEGEARVSITDYGQIRTDLFYGGPIGHDGWYGSIGGYFRRGDDQRSLGFVAANGGQVRARIGKEFEGGEFSIAYKKINDHTPYTNPLPVNVSGTYPTLLPGFNAQTQSLVGPDVRYITDKGPNGATTRDLASGEYENTDQLTLHLKYQLSDRLKMTVDSRYSHIFTSSRDFRGGSNGGTLFQANTYLTQELAVLQKAFPTTASVRLVRVNDGTVISNPAGLNGNGLLTIEDSIDYVRDNDQFINNVQFTYDAHALQITTGLQYWDVHTTSYNPQDQFLTDVKGNANRMNVQALNAAGQVVGNLTDGGVINFGSLDNYGGLDTISIDPYLNLELQATSALRIDGGIRYEHAVNKGWGEDVSFGVPLAPGIVNPLDLPDLNGKSISANGNIYTGRTTVNAVTWTIGANYKLASNLAIYGRFASTADMGSLNEFTYFNIPGFGASAGSNLGMTGTPTRLQFAEFGVRYQGRVISGTLTAFHTYYKNSGVITVGTLGNNVTTLVNTVANGLEYNVDLHPVRNFNVNFSGVIQNSKREGITTSASLPTYRVPPFQLHVTPTYQFGKVSLFGNIEHYSMRYADQNDTRKLPPYTSFGAGVTYAPTAALKLTAQGSNLTNTLGFTSGNFRESATQGPSPVGYATVIPGRSFRFSADYSF